MANSDKLITLGNLTRFKEKIVALIPTVNNATLTIQKNGSTIDTFTANASSNKTISISVPTGDADLQNNRYVRFDSELSGNSAYSSTQQGYARKNIGAAAISDITSSVIETALGYTPYDSSNPDGYTTNVGTITGVKVNGDSVASSGVAEITVPTKDSNLTNDRYVRFDSNAQGLSATQKSNARTNIGAGTSSFSGSYSDLTNKPTLGTAAALNTGTSSGNIPILDSNGKLNTSVLPALAISETFTAASQTAMTALTAQRGDICIRTDVSKTYILTQEPASTAANWKELATPADAVSSVCGKTGAVTLTATDVGAVSSVTIGVGTGLAINSSSAITSTGSRTISVASTHKLPTTEEWSSKADASAIPTSLGDFGLEVATNSDIDAIFTA